MSEPTLKSLCQKWSTAKVRTGRVHVRMPPYPHSGSCFLQASITHCPLHPTTTCHILLKPITCKLSNIKSSLTLLSFCCHFSTAQILQPAATCSSPWPQTPGQLQSNPHIISWSHQAPFHITTTSVEAPGGKSPGRSEQASGVPPQLETKSFQSNMLHYFGVNTSFAWLEFPSRLYHSVLCFVFFLNKIH